MEPIQDQVVYVFPTQNSKKLGRKTEGRFRLFRMPKRILPSRQDKNENENRFRAYALTCACGGWRHLDDGAAGSHGTCCSSTQTSRTLRRLRFRRPPLCPHTEHYTCFICDL